MKDAFFLANKSIISNRYKRFLVSLEKIEKSDIMNIHKGSESEWTKRHIMM